MIVLGLNGWIDRTHDAAAALVVDGHVVAFVEQERLSRNKHAIGEVPHAAVAAVLAMAGVGPRDVDLIAYGWDLPLFNAVRGRPLELEPEDAVMKICGFEPRPGQAIRWVDHHRAHAASAYFGSGFEEAAVLAIDAEGETGSTSIYAASGRTELRRVLHCDRAASLGLLYRAASIYCGFGPFGAGQVMGLASYGKPAPELPLRWENDQIVGPLPADADEDEIVAGWCLWLEERFGPPAPPGRSVPWEEKRPDAARLAQETIEGLVLALAEYARATTGYSDICLAGGVALNCTANGLLVSRVGRLYVPPAPHDAGVALGAALVASAEAGDPVWPLSTAALGPAYDEEVIEATLLEDGRPFARLADPARTAFGLLERDKVIGWFQGRMEVGPRSLGHRSILARADRAGMRDAVNDVKSRQRWRPLAPSMRREDATRLCDSPGDSPFMMLGFQLTEEARAAFPAVAHVDGSARLQTVVSDGSHFRRLLDCLAEAEGAGVVLNTSFNDAGEPIVCSPRDALLCYERIGLDALVIGSFLVERDGGPH